MRAEEAFAKTQEARADKFPDALQSILSAALLGYKRCSYYCPPGTNREMLGDYLEALGYHVSWEKYVDEIEISWGN